jgi:hypothetical protein
MKGILHDCEIIAKFDLTFAIIMLDVCYFATHFMVYCMKVNISIVI